MGRTLVLLFRQVVLVSLAALAYFGVRGLTEGDPIGASHNAARLLRLERLLLLDHELGIQSMVQRSEALVDVSNWVYIWGHWPVIIATLLTLAVVKPVAYLELRNAMFLSGAIGLVIFAIYPVSPPRLFSPEYLDTVTMRSNAYRVLQPPNLVNKFAAVPSLHVGWNLLVGLTWVKSAPGRLNAIIAAGVMTTAMAFAVVATANHWVLDVVIGVAVGVVGLGLERRRASWRSGPRPISRPVTATAATATAATAAPSGATGAVANGSSARSHCRPSGRSGSSDLSRPGQRRPSLEGDRADDLRPCRVVGLARRLRP